MERAEKIGLGIASAAHALLFAALSSSWLAAPKPLELNNRPLEVSIADEVSMQSAAPKLSPTPPPPAPGETEGPPEQAAPASPQSVPQPEPSPPAPAPKPKAEPKAVPRPAEKPKPAPEKTERKAAQKDSKPTSATKGKQEQSRGNKLKLDTSDWMKSSSRSTSADAKPTDGAMAASIGPAQKSALDAEIRRQLKPYWKAPTGADAEQLRTVVSVDLARDGSIMGSPQVVDTTGVTASNRTQVRLHQEQAIKAIRLAAPFKLPANLYSAWQSLQIGFDKRLSQ